MKATLRQLRAFDAIAALGGVAAAAERLNMSPSAVSTALKELQQSLDRPPLFQRVGRSLKITAEGERLQPRVRSLLREIEELENPAGAAQLHDTLAIGAVASAAYVLPKVLTAFRARHPGVQINLTVDQSQVLVPRLTSFGLDFVVTDSMARTPGSYLTEIYRERSALIAPPTSALARRVDLTFADLEATDWCMPGRVSLTNLRLHDAIRGRITNLRVAMEISSDEGVREAVKAGAGISCLPYNVVASDLASGALVELEVPGFAEDRPTYLMRMANAKAAPAAQALERHLLDAFAGPTGAS